MSKWDRIRFENNEYTIMRGGCHCCRTDKHYPPYEWEDMEDYNPINLEDLDMIEERLNEQLALVADLRKALIS